MGRREKREEITRGLSFGDAVIIFDAPTLEILDDRRLRKSASRPSDTSRMKFTS